MVGSGTTPPVVSMVSFVSPKRVYGLGELNLTEHEHSVLQTAKADEVEHPRNDGSITREPLSWALGDQGAVGENVLGRRTPVCCV